LLALEAVVNPSSGYYEEKGRKGDWERERWRDPALEAVENPSSGYYEETGRWSDREKR